MAARRIRAVVFDFDGTLVDSNQIKRDAYDAAFKGIPHAQVHVAAALTTYPDRDRRFIITSVVDTLRRGSGLRHAEVARLRASALDRYSRFCRTRVAGARDFPGVAATIRALAREYRLAINSGTPQTHLKQLIRARPWGGHCDLVFGAPATKVSNLQRIAIRFRIRSEQIVFVGDSATDADAAAQFGCAFVHAAHQPSPRLKACRRITAVTDLPRVIERLDRKRGSSV